MWLKFDLRFVLIETSVNLIKSLILHDRLHIRLKHSPMYEVYKINVHKLIMYIIEFIVVSRLLETF